MVAQWKFERRLAVDAKRADAEEKAREMIFESHIMEGDFVSVCYMSFGKELTVEGVIRFRRDSQSKILRIWVGSEEVRMRNLISISKK